MRKYWEETTWIEAPWSTSTATGLQNQEQDEQVYPASIEESGEKIAGPEKWSLQVEPPEEACWGCSSKKKSRRTWGRRDDGSSLNESMSIVSIHHSPNWPPRRHTNDEEEEEEERVHCWLWDDGVTVNELIEIAMVDMAMVDVVLEIVFKVTNHRFYEELPR